MDVIILKLNNMYLDACNPKFTILTTLTYKLMMPIIVDN